MNRALISVVIPAFNRAEFLFAAMQSLRRQNTRDMEILLIDDGSTDSLEDVARQYARELRYIRQKHRGQSAARNHGIGEASGEFIAFLDIDDTWAPQQLPRLLDALQLGPEIGIAQGLMCQVIQTPQGSWQSAPYRMPYLGSCLFRRWVFDKCGRFDETMAFGEDYDFLFRCWENDVPKVHIDSVSLLYRRHSGNLTTGKNHAAHVLVIKRRIERIRAGLIDPLAPRRAPFQSYIGDLSGMTDQDWQAARWIN